MAPSKNYETKNEINKVYARGNEKKKLMKKIENKNCLLIITKKQNKIFCPRKFDYS